MLRMEIFFFCFNKREATPIKLFFSLNKISRFIGGCLDIPKTVRNINKDEWNIPQNDDNK